MEAHGPSRPQTVINSQELPGPTPGRCPSAPRSNMELPEQLFAREKQDTPQLPLADCGEG